MRSLRNKVAVITGATGGMGRALAESLAEQGAKLVLTSTSEEKLDELKLQLENKGASVIAVRADVTKEEQVRALFGQVEQAYGKADMLVNLAGLSIPAKVESMEEEQYDLSMDVNLKGTFLCSKYFVPVANREAGASIINIGSMAAKRANPNAPMYCTAKAAVNMFSQGLALQVKEQNIRVTTLNPGGADTGFWGDRQVPREKFLLASDVADVILFVLSSDSRIAFHEINFESFYAL